MFTLPQDRLNALLLEGTESNGVPLSPPPCPQNSDVEVDQVSTVILSSLIYTYLCSLSPSTSLTLPPSPNLNKQNKQIQTKTNLPAHCPRLTDFLECFLNLLHTLLPPVFAHALFSIGF